MRDPNANTYRPRFTRRAGFARLPDGVEEPALTDGHISKYVGALLDLMKGEIDLLAERRTALEINYATLVTDV